MKVDTQTAYILGAQTTFIIVSNSTNVNSFSGAIIYELHLFLRECLLIPPPFFLVKGFFYLWVNNDMLILKSYSFKDKAPCS